MGGVMRYLQSEREWGEGAVYEGRGGGGSLQGGSRERLLLHLSTYSLASRSTLLVPWLQHWVVPELQSG